MPSQKVIKSALSGFLGTYTSRYSDYRGYWLVGLVEDDLDDREIDLLAQAPEDDTPQAFMNQLAVRRFAEQIGKTGLPLSIIQEAKLKITVRPEKVKGYVGSHASDGHTVVFAVRAVMDTGHTYEKNCSVFVAPHDPDRERRRLPEKWGV